MKKRIFTIMAFAVIGFSALSAQSAGDARLAAISEMLTESEQHGGSEEAFVRFMTTTSKKLNNAEGRKAMSRFYASSTAPGGGMSYDDYLLLMEIIKGMTDEEIAQLLVYVEKVYPLYNYHMSDRVIPEKENMRDITIDTVYAAPFDEAYYGLGDDRNRYYPYGMSTSEKFMAIADGARLKHNGSYAWGMTNYEGKLYWSTNNNYLCMQGYGNFVQPGVGDSAYENDCWVCEYEKGVYGRVEYIFEEDKQKYSDIRPPRMYCYDPKTGVIEDITPKGNDYQLLKNCQGLRSAGAHKGVVFFGGPGLYGDDLDSDISSAFVAYDADAQRVISSNDMSKVQGCKVVNVRRWIVYGDVLYVSVGLLHPVTNKKMGAVLRWYGDKENPWDFRIVGTTDGEAAELTVFKNRMYVGTWGGTRGSCVAAGPEMPAGGLEPVDIDTPNWKTVWGTNDYEHTATLGRTVTSVAGFREWRNHLYWGVFCPDFYILQAAEKIYGTLFSPDALAYILGNYRTASFWRLDNDNTVELLYGETELPKPVYDSTGSVKEWTFEQTGWTPKWGRSGFGNFWTIYVWSLHVYGDNLYIGTMDMSNLAGAVLTNKGASTKATTSDNIYGYIEQIFGMSEREYGFELLRMTDEEQPPRLITSNGFNNPAAYGIRNFDVIDNTLYIGTASPFNLKEFGGWHIHSLTDKNVTTGIEQPKAVEAGVIMRRTDNYINLVTLKGDNITSVEVYDTAGRKLSDAKPDSRVASVPLSLIKGVAVIKVQTESGAWSMTVAEK